MGCRKDGERGGKVFHKRSNKGRKISSQGVGQGSPTTGAKDDTVGAGGKGLAKRSLRAKEGRDIKTGITVRGNLRQGE